MIGGGSFGEGASSKLADAVTGGIQGFASGVGNLFQRGGVLVLGIVFVAAGLALFGRSSNVVQVVKKAVK
jgi:hypothetical protein